MSHGSLVKNIILRTICHRAFIFHMQIGLGKDKHTINFRFTRSKVKVTRVTFEKKLIMFPLIILRTVCHKAFIFNMLIGRGVCMTCIYGLPCHRSRSQESFL